MVFFDNTYMGSELIFEMGVTSLPDPNFKGNGEWLVVNSSRHIEFNKDIAGISFAVFTYRLRRKSLFTLINIISPIVLLFVLQMFVFILPAESGERVGFIVTMLLAIAVFLTIISDGLPKVSEPLPAICYYLLAALCFSTLMTVAVIVNLAIYYKEGSVPAYLSSVTNIILCCCCKTRTVRPQVRYKHWSERTSDIQMIGAAISYGKFLSPKKGAPIVNWKDVSKAIDILCILFFLVSFIALNGYGVYYAMSQQNTYRASYFSKE